MVTKSNYLKSYKSMSEAEKRDYIQRVDKWTEETFPELMAHAESWITVPEKDYDEGVILASALRSAQGFINNAQRYEAKKAIQILNSHLMDVRNKSGLSKVKVREAGDKRKFIAVVPSRGIPQEDGTLKQRNFEEVDVDGRRPEHISQYINMLPNTLRIEAEGIKFMYLELADYRHNLEVLSKDPRVSDEARADLAKKCVKAEQKIRFLWDRIDKAYNKATGQADDDDDEETEVLPTAMPMKRSGEYTKVEIEAMQDEEMKELCKSARIDLNKKYVRRGDVKITPEYREQLSLRIRELMEWGENVPKKAYKMCQEAGVTVSGFNDDDEIAAKNAAEADAQEDESDIPDVSLDESKAKASTEQFIASDKGRTSIDSNK